MNYPETRYHINFIDFLAHYFRPKKVEILLGDASKAKEIFGKTPEITIDELIKEMVQHDLLLAKRESLLQAHSYSAGNEKK